MELRRLVDGFMMTVIGDGVGSWLSLVELGRYCGLTSEAEVLLRFQSTELIECDMSLLLVRSASGGLLILISTGA